MEHMQTEAERTRANPRQAHEGCCRGLHAGIIAQTFALVNSTDVRLSNDVRGRRSARFEPTDLGPCYTGASEPDAWLLE